MSIIESSIQHLFARYPELSGEPVRVNSIGYQNQVIIIGERLVFRFPLTEDKSSILLEQRLLPVLREHLTLEVPRILYASEPGDSIAFIGYPLIRGKSLFRDRFLALNAQQQEEAAKKIGFFLTELHYFKDASIPAIPREEFNINWRRYWAGYYKVLAKVVFPYIPIEGQIWVMTMFHEFLYPEEHFQFQPCLIHGDFKSDHILVDENGRVKGVIDFGMLKVGDPAIDFADMFNTYGETFAWKVFRYYKGPADPAFFHRCRLFYQHILGLSSLINAISNSDENELKHWTNQLMDRAESDSF